MNKSLLVLMAMVSVSAKAESSATIRPGLYAKNKNAECALIIDRIPGDKDLLLAVVSMRVTCKERFLQLVCDDVTCTAEYKQDSGIVHQVNLSATERGILLVENYKDKKGQWKLYDRSLYVELDSQCASKARGGSRE